MNQFSVTISIRNKSKMVDRISTIPSSIEERRVYCTSIEFKFPFMLLDSHTYQPLIK